MLELPTGTLFPDGGSAFLLRTADANAAELERHQAGDGDAWRALLAEFLPNADLAFGVFNRLYCISQRYSGRQIER